MRTANTSYKQNGVPVSIPSGSYGIAHLTVHQYEYPKGQLDDVTYDTAFEPPVSDYELDGLDLER